MIYNPLQLSTRLSPLFLVHSVEPSIQENGDEAGEGREAKETDPGSPRRCDIIIISGRKEKCEAAKEALEVRWPCPFSAMRFRPCPGGSRLWILASVLKCMHLLYTFLGCSHSPGNPFLFTRTQDSTVHSLTAVSGSSLLGHSHGVCKRISLAVSVCELQPHSLLFHLPTIHAFPN